jgi:hypothetical protein
MIYGTYLPGIAFNGAVSMALDSNGNTYMTGGAQPGQFKFPVTAGAYQSSSNELYTGVVIKLNPAGSAMVYATYLGGNTSGDRTLIAGIAVDGVGNAYVTGSAPPDFPTTSGTLQPQSGTVGISAFVTKLNPEGSGLARFTRAHVYHRLGEHPNDPGSVRGDRDTNGRCTAALGGSLRGY